MVLRVCQNELEQKGAGGLAVRHPAADAGRDRFQAGVVAYRPDYHRKDRDKNTVLFYLPDDAEHNRKVDREPTHYTRSEAHDLMKYGKVNIPDRYIWRDPFWSFENSDVNGMLDYSFANYGKLDLRTNRWVDVLEGHVRLALAKKLQYLHIAGSGGYLALREADAVNDDPKPGRDRRHEADLRNCISGGRELLWRKRARILAGEESIFEEVTDGPVYNFAGTFCVPKKDPELEWMILAWNGDDRLPKKGADVNKMQNRVAAIGGINLVWY